MSDIPGRVYRIAKAYLDAARGRLEEIDSLAQAELEKSLDRDDIRIPAPPPTSPGDPMERAAAKIAAAQRAATARREVSPGEAGGAAPVADPVQTAYKIIGVTPGSDYATVQLAVTKLRERCAPSRFPNGSPEQAESQVILQRIEEAFQVLKNALGVSENRFEKLEF